MATLNLPNNPQNGDSLTFDEVILSAPDLPDLPSGQVGAVVRGELGGLYLGEGEAEGDGEGEGGGGEGG